MTGGGRFGVPAVADGSLGVILQSCVDARWGQKGLRDDSPQPTIRLSAAGAVLRPEQQRRFGTDTRPSCLWIYDSETAIDLQLWKIRIFGSSE